MEAFYDSLLEALKPHLRDYLTNPDTYAIVAITWGLAVHGHRMLKPWPKAQKFWDDLRGILFFALPTTITLASLFTDALGVYVGVAGLTRMAYGIGIGLVIYAGQMGMQKVLDKFAGGDGKTATAAGHAKRFLT